MILSIDEITNIMNEDYFINDSIKNTWSTFINHIINYNDMKKKAIRSYQKLLLIDFYRYSNNIVSEMYIKINLLSIRNKKLELQVKNDVYELIDNYLKINYNGINNIN